jgi:hypothetical protein
MNSDLPRGDPFPSEGHSLIGPAIVFNALAAALIIVYEEITRDLTLSFPATSSSGDFSLAHNGGTL